MNLTFWVLVNGALFALLFTNHSDKKAQSKQGTTETKTLLSPSSIEVCLLHLYRIKRSLVGPY